jgi:hypothetical protein
MSIIDVEKLGVHGGSIRVYAGKGGGKPSESVDDLLMQESKSGLDKTETYREFARHVQQIRDELVALLSDLKNSRKKIAGYGASAKGNTLLNYCKIGTDFLDYINDTTPFKQGCYTPGVHIPVVPESRFHQDPPDYSLMLAWNYADEILQKEQGYRQAGGKFIVPIPKPQIV